MRVPQGRLPRGALENTAPTALAGAKGKRARAEVGAAHQASHHDLRRRAISDALRRRAAICLYLDAWSVFSDAFLGTSSIRLYRKLDPLSRVLQGMIIRIGIEFSPKFGRKKKCGREYGQGPLAP